MVYGTVFLMALPSSLAFFIPALVLSFGVTVTDEFAFCLVSHCLSQNRPNTQHKPVLYLGTDRVTILRAKSLILNIFIVLASTLKSRSQLAIVVLT